MDGRDLLHTAARRYCLEATAREVAPGGGDTPTARHDRSMVLDPLLHEIERTVPTDFATVGELRDFLLGTGARVRHELVGFSATGGGDSVVEETRITCQSFTPAQEVVRERFLAYVRALSEADLGNVQPLPYRQVLSDTESRRIRALLRVRWEVDDRQHLWHPLWARPVPETVLAVQARAFDAAVGGATLRAILAARGIARVWELSERGWLAEYVLDLDLCHFSGCETYWSSPALDWLVYQSHEETLAVAGDWLIAAVKEAWPTWADHEWWRPPPSA